MNVLIVNAFDPTSDDHALVDTAVATLEENGHEVGHRQLVGGPYEAFMSPEERSAYHGDEPLISPETIEDAHALKAADALVFCYPTTTFTIPAVLKSWLERVLVPGVAFVFDEQERVRPGMENIRRLGAITTTPHSSVATARAHDAGRRTLMWNIRLSCHRLARRTFVSLPVGSGADDGTEKVRRALSRW